MTNFFDRPLSRRTGLAALGGLGLALSGCMTPTPDAPSPAASKATSATPTLKAPLAATDPKAPVTINWWTGQSADAETTLEGLAKEFMGLHPNVTLKVSSGAATTDELLTKLSSAFAANTYPDVSYAFGSWASELAQSGKALDVSGSVAQASMAWDEFPQAARETASPGGKTIGLPAIVDNLGLFYNKSVFDKAGVAYPTDDWSWDGFRAAAKKLTNASANVFGAAMAVDGSEDTTWHMWPQLWQNGGTVLSPDEKTATFNSAAGVTTVKFWQDMAQVDKSLYLDQTGQKYEPMFESGNVAMMITGPWHLFPLTETKTKYGVVRLPGTNGDHQTVSGPDIWAMFDHGDANRAYWTFELIRWLTDPAQDARWNLAMGNLPLRSSTMKTAAFAEAAKAYPGFETLANNLMNAKNKRPTVVGYVELSKIYSKAVAGLLQSTSDVKSVLDKAAAAATEALASR